MKKLRIMFILVLILLFGVTGCDKKNSNDNPLESTTSITTTSTKETTTSSTTTTTKKTTTSKKTTTTKKSTKAQTTTTKTTKKEGPTLIDGKPECDKNNAEFVAYVENYKKEYASKSDYFAKVEPYTIFFYTKSESDDYTTHASRLGYGYDGSSIPYENSTCKGKMYTVALVIRSYNGHNFNPAVYIPVTPKNKLISAENYLKQNNLI